MPAAVPSSSRQLAHQEHIVLRHVPLAIMKCPSVHCVTISTDSLSPWDKLHVGDRDM